MLVRLAPPPLAAEAVHAREDHVSEALTREATVAGPSLEGLVLDDVDLTDLDVWEERVPYEWLALLRREAPLHWHPERDGRGFWVLTRYDDVVQVSKDWQTFSSELGGSSLQDLTPDELEARKSMIDTDPPPHTRMRALVNTGFTPGSSTPTRSESAASHGGSWRRPSSRTRSTGSSRSPPSSRCGSSRRSWASRSRTGV